MSLPCLMVHPYISLLNSIKCLIKSPVITSTCTQKEWGPSLALTSRFAQAIYHHRSRYVPSGGSHPVTVGQTWAGIWGAISDVGWLMLSHSLRSALPLKTKSWSMGAIFEVATWWLRLFPIKTYLCRCGIHVYPLEVQHGTVLPAVLGPDVIL